jgi:small-conductance mechanosensitive channel
MNSISGWLEEYWNLDPIIQRKILVSLVVLVVLWLLRVIINKIIFQNVTDLRGRYFWKNITRNTHYVLIIIIISAIWAEVVGSLATFFGFVTAGFAIALQDPIVNLAGWLFIIIRRPFEIGDRIQIGQFSGDVIDIRFFQFTINEIGNWVQADQSTGRIVHIPNGQVFKVAQANFNQGFGPIWNEIGVMVTFESNWQKAKKIMEEILDRHAINLTKDAKDKLLEASKKFMIIYSSLTPIVYTSVKDSGVMLTMRYMVDPKKRRITENDIWEEVLKMFADHDDIDFAYPTRRIYNNLQEGKSGNVKEPNFPREDRGKRL